jgi:hypothetical protein
VDDPTRVTDPQLMDRLLAVRAMAELDVRQPHNRPMSSRSAVRHYRSALESQANDARDAGSLAECGRAWDDRIQCERAYGHGGPCAALIVF